MSKRIYKAVVTFKIRLAFYTISITINIYM